LQEKCIFVLSTADIPYINAGLSAQGWMFCEEEDPETCSMHEWCDWLTCENLLCNMTRADKREEGEEFKCYAWRKKNIE